MSLWNTTGMNSPHSLLLCVKSAYILHGNFPIIPLYVGVKRSMRKGPQDFEKYNGHSICNTKKGQGSEVWSPKVMHSYRLEVTLQRPEYGVAC